MTIFALSSAQGRAGVAVIRLSGKEAPAALRAMTGGAALPRPRAATLKSLHHPSSQELIDRALVLFFPAPHSFTGEDVVELHVHGGRAVIEAVFAALNHAGLRLAQPGEFSRRAFEHGKLDLTQAEGLLDLIEAETAAQRRQALAQAGGALKNRYETWRSQLLHAMAYVEASLDFSDEGDIADDAIQAALPHVDRLISHLEQALADGSRGELIRGGLHVAIVGPPNAGKSSLLNALVGRQAAIVFDEPGTTRDIIEVSLDLEGYLFVMRDTAGLREAAHPIEREGIKRAITSAREADYVLFVRDGSDAANTYFACMPEIEAAKLIRVMNKADIASSSAALPQNLERDELAISAQTGAGLDGLKNRLITLARTRLEGAEQPSMTRARHRDEVSGALAALKRFAQGFQNESAPELLAQDLRDAADSLSRLTGRLDVEEVLGQIFGEFCIGK